MEFTFKYSKSVFNLCVHGKYNFIVGDSGTGKTFLSTCLQRNEVTKMGSVTYGVTLISYNKFILDYIVSKKPVIEGLIVYCDELDVERTGFKQFYSLIGEYKCIFIVASRELPKRIAFGASNIFELAVDGSDYTMQLAYPWVYESGVTSIPQGYKLVCEDKDSAPNCFASYMKDRVVRGNGRTNITKVARDTHSRTVLYFDSCGIGAMLPKVDTFLKENPWHGFYPCVSFEYDVMRSPIFHEYDLPLYTIDQSVAGESEEKYYERVLCERLKESFGLKYSKSDIHIAEFLGCDVTWMPRLE